MTLRLAKTQDGTTLLGDDVGFVPVAAVAPELRTVRDVLQAAPSGLPDPADAPARRIPAADVAFGPPLCPGKLLGIGLNYVGHADDLSAKHPDEPASFFKPATAVTGPQGPIRLPPPDLTDRVTAEAELAVVLGRTCSDIHDSETDDVVAGLLPVIDMTAEDILQRNPRFLTRAKSFDTFLVLGPWIELRNLDGLADTTVKTIHNDDVVAEDVVENMAFSPTELVAYHSRVMTLEPGDIISTGTPGAAHIESGDSVRATIDGIGSVGTDVV